MTLKIQLSATQPESAKVDALVLLVDSAPENNELLSKIDEAVGGG